MTPDELQRAYPACYDAVLWCETIVCTPGDNTDSCLELMRGAGYTLEQAHEFVVQSLMESPEVGSAKKLEVDRQLRSPEFMEYLRGRMA